MNTCKTFIAALFAASASASGDKCFALALGSGEENTAWQAGVLQGLMNKYGIAEHDYDAISGISGGSVNAAIFGSYASGQEDLAVERMITFWKNAANSDLYKDWLGGVAQGLFYEGGLYNPKPLAEFLASELADIGEMQRYVNVGLTDVNSGKYVENTSGHNMDTHLQDVLFASFAYAGFFPPAESMDTYWFDGSVVWDVDIFSAVNKCLGTHAAGDIVLDVILTESATLKTVDASHFTSLQMYFRYLEVSRYYSNMDGLLRAEFAYPDVAWRFLVVPSDPLPVEKIPLNIDSDTMDLVVAQGVLDGGAAIPFTSNTDDMLDYFGLKKKNDGRVSGVSFEEFVEKKQMGEFADFNRKTDKHLIRKYSNYAS